MSVASCQARSILFKASYKLPGQVARQVASGKLTGQVGKLQVARSSCQQVGNLPAQVDKLPAMGGTGDHELNSGFLAGNQLYDPLVTGEADVAMTAVKKTMS